MTRLLLDIPGVTVPGGTPGQWAVIALGIVTILYVVVIRPMRKGRVRRDPLERPARLGTLAQQRAVERDMGNLLVEYEEMIRRMTAQVDTRATKLELLIKDAEDAIARLKAAVAGAAGAGAAATTGGSDGAGRPEPSAKAGDGSGQPDASSGPDGAEGVAQTVQPPTETGAPGDAIRSDQRYAEVYRLADASQSAPEIAKALGRPYGEIELILALRRDRPARDEEGSSATPEAVAEEESAHAASTADDRLSPRPSSLHDQGRRGRKKHRSPQP